MRPSRFQYIVTVETDETDPAVTGKYVVDLLEQDRKGIIEDGGVPLHEFVSLSWVHPMVSVEEEG